MKRPIFIIIGIVIVFILLLVWVYMLFFNTPQNNDETFADLDIGDTTDTNYDGISIDNNNEESVVDFSSPERLRQLTTKPIIGFTEFSENASSTPQIMYAEAGTGHVYSIDTVSGEEVRISAVTIPSSQAAEITPDGKFMMVRSGEGIASKFIIQTLNATSGEASNQEINESILNFSASEENKFLLAVKTNNATVGKVYDPINNSFQTLFTIPFRDATIDWGYSVNDSHYAYPKTTSQLESFLFEIKGNKTTRLPIDGYGMSAVGDEQMVIYSKQSNLKYETFIYNKESGSVNFSGIVTIPEKCQFSRNTPELAICAQSFVDLGPDIPDSWYAGDLSFADSLWEVSTLSPTKLLVDTEEDSGREIDIINIELGKDDANIYFVNKNDNTLWLYERTQEVTTIE